jgi:hypothetical protein
MTPRSSKISSVRGWMPYHPRRRRAGWFSIIRAKGAQRRAYRGWRDAFELVAEILEVLRADAQPSTSSITGRK